ncbi:MAG TPA: isoprenylcysteine carboxylmethyltransferase family protein [Polyangiaceae bacterium]|jgi:protein-S-isoprenylcysteine O-methyltransferase Ste14|nr:isoprenylcysteine carboxylmethyltransferase family protein [Polyangiaceae bacterium]
MPTAATRQTALGLRRRALVGLAQLAAGMALALFLPGGFGWIEGWVFLAVFLLSSALTTLYIQRHDPALLERRLKAGFRAEQRPRQKLVQGLASLAFAVAMVVPALDHRFGWSHVSLAGVVLGNVMVALGYLAVLRVLEENSFASALIEVGSEQRVIDTGPYALVRHPMYGGALVMLAGIPLALGSLWGLCVLPLFVALLVWRLIDEETLLVQDLPGYDNYRERVRYRLVPRLW